ncbi:dihydropteroate synthase, partial [Streptococcus agalactiae]|nr:dihydropteroate synthase [Streptococcus agalactiae]
MKIGQYDITGKACIMGILNVTPDSFSDGGSYTTIDSALNQVGEMLEQGVAIVDIGGESTRPGAVFVTAEEEIKRVVPMIKAIREVYPDLLLSID